MSKQEVIDYVMTTPSNPNRAVLSGMLDEIADASGGGLILKVSETVGSKTYFDHTWEEVDNAMKAGTPVYVLQESTLSDMAGIQTFNALLPVVGTYYSADSKTSSPTETFEANVVYAPPSADTASVLILKANSADGRLYTGA